MATKKSKKRRKVLVLAVILLGIGGLTTAAMLQKREAIINVQTEKVSRRNLTEVVFSNGRIQPVLQVKISPEVSGEIIELAVKEGQTVKKGDVLLRIKPDTYLAQRNSTEASHRGSVANLGSAVASFQKASNDFQRIEALFRSQLVPESEYVSVKSAFDMSKAQLASSTNMIEVSKAALERAEEDLRKTTIKAPLDGTVSRLNSQLGERVVGTAMMAGTDVMTIADLNEMEARVDIGEYDIVLIAVGQRARLEVDAFKDRKFNGLVTEIANSAKGTGMGMGGGGQSQEATKFEVKIRIQEKEIFRPGMSVTADIETRYRTNVLTVPIASVTTRLPKPPPGGGKTNLTGSATNRTAAGKTNIAGGTNARPSAPTGGTSTVAASSPPAGASNTIATNTASASATNGLASTSGKKANEPPKPIEVVFLKNSERAKMVTIKRGISDDAYMEITEGLKEGDEVISGGFKAINKELEDGKKVRLAAAKPEADKEKK